MALNLRTKWYDIEATCEECQAKVIAIPTNIEGWWVYSCKTCGHTGNYYEEVDNAKRM